ncbi:MAG: hypothetical protein J07HQX50_01762 [Haloquadratum sp. J07HQX50]|nr:MAG: hypothetical protein J07HQX50_01762 [Haloquadratum sp. J07HQX50]
METEAHCISKEVLIARLWGCTFSAHKPGESDTQITYPTVRYDQSLDTEIP